MLRLLFVVLLASPLDVCLLPTYVTTMKTFQMFWSDKHREWVELRAAHFGITKVEYLRRLIDEDRSRHDSQQKHQTKPQVHD